MPAGFSLMSEQDLVNSRTSALRQALPSPVRSLTRRVLGVPGLSGNGGTPLPPGPGVSGVLRVRSRRPTRRPSGRGVGFHARTDSAAVTPLTPHPSAAPIHESAPRPPNGGPSPPPSPSLPSSTVRGCQGTPGKRGGPSETPPRPILEE